MSGWRDQVPTQTQDDMDALTEAALSVAQDQLEATGQLPPVAVVMLPDGALEARGAVEPDGDTRTLIAELEAALAADAAQLRAAAFVTDVHLDGGEAIQVTLEHRDTAAPTLILALPYQRKRGRVRGYGDLRATAGRRRVWTD